MRNFLLCFFLAVSVSDQAQPMIDSSNFTPLMRERFERQRCKFTSVNYENSGANFTWNFTNAPFVSIDTLVYDSVDANNCDNHNYSVFAGRNFSFRLINTNTNCASDFKIYSNSGMSEAGYGQSNAVADYDYVAFPFPLTSTTVYSVQVNYTAYQLSPYSTWSHVYWHSLIADGFGDLNLPNSLSYTGCLRLREIIYDTANVSTPSFDTIYYWIKPGIHHPVLTVFRNTPWQDAYYVNHIDRVDIPSVERNNSHAFLFPNPTTGELYVALQNLRENNCLIISNSMGQIVLKKELTNMEGSCDITSLPSGIYFAYLKDKSMKIIKQ